MKQYTGHPPLITLPTLVLSACVSINLLGLSCWLQWYYISLKLLSLFICLVPASTWAACLCLCLSLYFLLLVQSFHSGFNALAQQLPWDLSLCLCCQCLIQDVLDLDHHPPGDSASSLASVPCVPVALASLSLCAHFPFIYVQCSLSFFQVNSSWNLLDVLPEPYFSYMADYINYCSIVIIHLFVYSVSSVHTLLHVCLSVPSPPLNISHLFHIFPVLFPFFFFSSLDWGV